MNSMWKLVSSSFSNSIGMKSLLASTPFNFSLASSNYASNPSSSSGSASASTGFVYAPGSSTFMLLTLNSGTCALAAISEIAARSLLCGMPKLKAIKLAVAEMY